jgi:hypothetical protein
MNRFKYSFTVILPWFKSENSFFFNLRVPRGHIVSSKMSLELILGDILDIGVGVAVSLPLVC